MFVGNYYITVYFKTQYYLRIHSQPEFHCTASECSIFVQSDGNIPKVYVFRKLSSRAFQKYILLICFGHSEENDSPMQTQQNDGLEW